MKKILIILAVIFLVFIVAIIIFALTFDVNRYKGAIIERASHAIQKDIALEHLSLDFSRGLGCRIEDLAVKEKDVEWDDAWLNVRDAQISVRILPLFKKDVQVNRIDIEGLDLKLTRELLEQPTRPSGHSQDKTDTGAMALGALKFLARVIVVKDSVITYMPTKSGDAIKIDISTLMLNNPEKLYLDPEKIWDSGVVISLEKCSIDMPAVPGGIKDIELDAVLAQNSLSVRKLKGSAAGGTFLIQGSVKDISSSQVSKFDISCSGINLVSLFPRPDPKSPYFEGIADLEAAITGEGLQQNQLMQGLTGSGLLKVDKPVLKNMNILRTAFEKMDMIPGLVARLRENLPESYTEVLKRNDTVFKSMDVTYSVSRGKLIFKDAAVESDGFLVKAQGEAGFRGDIQIGSYLFIAPELSRAFIDIVRELRFLADEQGMINMPLSITGKAPRVSVNIDRDYILRKLIFSKGSELLENIFKRKDKHQEEPQSRPDESQQDTQNSNIQQKKDRPSEPAALIKAIFDIIESQDK